jgi:CrcB protein
MWKNPKIRASLAISLGAIAGASCRYYLGQWLIQSIETSFPMGTLIVNLSGCLLMGLVTAFSAGRFLLSPDLILLLTTGFLGSYTTFSSYELDAANLLKVKNLQGYLIYWIGSPLLGFLCFGLGVKLAKFAQSSNQLKQ